MMLSEARVRGDRFLLAANRSIRYDWLMEKIYPHVEARLQNKRYQILQGEKPAG